MRSQERLRFVQLWFITTSVSLKRWSALSSPEANLFQCSGLLLKYAKYVVVLEAKKIDWFHSGSTAKPRIQMNRCTTCYSLSSILVWRSRLDHIQADRRSHLSIELVFLTLSSQKWFILIIRYTIFIRLTQSTLIKEPVLYIIVGVDVDKYINHTHFSLFQRSLKCVF